MNSTDIQMINNIMRRQYQVLFMQGKINCSNNQLTRIALTAHADQNCGNLPGNWRGSYELNTSDAWKVSLTHETSLPIIRLTYLLKRNRDIMILFWNGKNKCQNLIVAIVVLKTNNNSHLANEKWKQNNFNVYKKLYYPVFLLRSVHIRSWSDTNLSRALYFHNFLYFSVKND